MQLLVYHFTRWLLTRFKWVASRLGLHSYELCLWSAHLIVRACSLPPSLIHQHLDLDRLGLSIEAGWLDRHGVGSPDAIRSAHRLNLFSKDVSVAPQIFYLICNFSCRGKPFLLLCFVPCLFSLFGRLRKLLALTDHFYVTFQGLGVRMSCQIGQVGCKDAHLQGMSV